MSIDYEADINIDETALDVEWLDQPRKMFQYCKHAARMRKEADLAKEAVDVEKAKLDREIRSNPDQFGIDKITEAVVQSTILAHPRYQRKMGEFIGARYELDMAQNAIRAFEQRKTALENLVRLHGMSYFAGPGVPRDLTKEREKRDKSSNERVKIKRRK